MTEPGWRLWPLQPARDDLKTLKRRNRKIFREACDIIDQVQEDPFIGEPCDPPYQDVRKIHFWDGDHRVLWRPIPETKDIDLIGAGYKGNDSHFYPQMFRRLQGNEEA